MIIFNFWDTSDRWQNSPQSFPFLCYSCRWSLKFWRCCWMLIASMHPLLLLFPFPFNAPKSAAIPYTTRVAHNQLSFDERKPGHCAISLMRCREDKFQTSKTVCFEGNTAFTPTKPPQLIDSNQTHRGGDRPASLACALRRLIRMRRQRLKMAYKYLTRPRRALDSEEEEQEEEEEDALPLHTKNSWLTVGDWNMRSRWENKSGFRCQADCCCCQEKFWLSETYSHNTHTRAAAALTSISLCLDKNTADASDRASLSGRPAG